MLRTFRTSLVRTYPIRTFLVAPINRFPISKLIHSADPVECSSPNHVPHFDPKVPGCIKFKGATGTWLLQGSFGQGPVRFDPLSLLLASWGTPLKTAPSRSWCLRSCFYNRACWDTTNFTHLSDLRWLMFELTGFKSEFINIFDSGYANLSLLLPLVATAMSGFFKSKCDDIKQI